ncbi:MAG: hypothetical protein LRS41_03165 [Caldisphaeraceae archaeon]|nr:hypothetical protein [Caldisphaeraceae archaeon]
MLVFEGKISRWRHREYVIYTPRRYGSIVEGYYGKQFLSLLRKVLVHDKGRKN